MRTPAPALREISIHVRLSVAEARELDRLRRRYGMTRPQMIRWTVLDMAAREFGQRGAAS